MRITIIFTLLFASATFLTTAATSDISDNNFIENEIIKMSVTPDPESDDTAIINLYSEFSEANIVIFNATGIVVFEEAYPVDKDKENAIKLDLSQLKTGTYYILHDESNDTVTYGVR